MPALDDPSRHHLLRVARSAIARAIGADLVSRTTAETSHPLSVAVGERRAGAFVTLHVKGDLRGCIGYPDPELPLLEVVERCAVSAAISDPRFPAVSVEEWRDVEIEISVLGPIEPVGDISEIVIGTHGLIAELGYRRGLLLPQVASERGWTAKEFASQTCFKAGLRGDAWQSGARLFKFEAQVFGET
jgi:AmmeMemoRadiSam system protein A